MEQRQPPPVQTPMLNAAGLCVHPWLEFFRALLEQRVTSSRGDLADIPAALTEEDEGYLYYAADYKRQYYWNGTAWERAPGEAPHHYAWFDADPGDGWALADGSSVTQTTDDGGTESHNVVDLIGYYVKGASSVAGPNAAVAPGFTDPAISTDAAGITTTDSGNASIGGPSATTIVQAGAGATVASSGHNHADSGHTHGITDPSHTHTASGGAVDATGEPANQELLPYYRL